MSFQSNQTGLRIAEEAVGSPKTLPGSPVWEPVEPNSYKDFGAEVKTTKREPIAADRQNRKGSVTDLDAMAGFQVDFTTRSLLSTIPGFMFANWRKKLELNTTAVTGTSYTVASGGAGFLANDLVYAEDHATGGNNGAKLVTASTATSVSVAGLTAKSETGKITKVGFQFASGDLALTVAGGQATLAATAKDLTQLGLIPGEWIYVGGDAAGNRFNTAGCAGFYRVKTIAAGSIVCDRYPDGAVTDAGTGKTVRVFMGNALKNEAASADQVFRTYQAERTYSSDKLEYILGMAPSALKITTKTADKLTAELDFVALDSDVDTSVPKAGARPAVKAQTAFSASSDFTRLRLMNTADASSMAVYLTDIDLSIDNGIEVDKAIGSLGGVGFSFGNFVVSGSVEAYFSSLDAVQAVKDNATVALDFGLVANTNIPDVGNTAQGWLFDVPAIDLGDGRLKVEKDKKIKLPLNLEAHADGTFNHTMLVVFFPFLPQLAL
jgi:hypothetical protein